MEKENAHLQRQSSWTCDSVTISYASRRGTNRCRRCKGFLAEGELRFGMIFKSHNQHMLFQGFHLSCINAPTDLTCPTELEGIQDVSPTDVEMIRRWIQTGMAPPALSSLSAAKEGYTAAPQPRQGLVESSLS
eukprot:jgi/Undpi1/6900/HiC_scaffold_21.g09376.m1